MNNSEKIYRQKLFLLSFIDPESFNDKNQKHTIKELNDYDTAIEDCQGMLNYYIDKGNKEEIKNWKQLLQQAKTEKRMLRSMIENEITERELLTT